jgi:hypothetical protein
MFHFLVAKGFEKIPKEPLKTEEEIEKEKAEGKALWAQHEKECEENLRNLWYESLKENNNETEEV